MHFLSHQTKYCYHAWYWMGKSRKSLNGEKLLLYWSKRRRQLDDLYYIHSCLKGTQQNGKNGFVVFCPFGHMAHLEHRHLGSKWRTKWALRPLHLSLYDTVCVYNEMRYGLLVRCINSVRNCLRAWNPFHNEYSSGVKSVKLEKNWTMSLLCTVNSA